MKSNPSPVGPALADAMRVHAFVLHLTRAQARRENAETLLKTCGLPGELWAAVDGKELSNQDLAAGLKGSLFEPRYPFMLIPAEIGCFMSHKQIWAEIVRRKLDHALVLEDDVALDETIFPKALSMAMRHAKNYGYVQLQNRPIKGTRVRIDQDGPSELTLPVVAPVRASAQLISGWAAQKLLDKAQSFDRPVDTYVQSHWHTGLRPAVIYPSGVRTISDDLDGSTIQPRKRSLGQTLWREIARPLYRRQVKRFSQKSAAPVPSEGSAP